MMTTDIMTVIGEIVLMVKVAVRRRAVTRSFYQDLEVVLAPKNALS